MSSPNRIRRSVVLSAVTFMTLAGVLSPSVSQANEEQSGSADLAVTLDATGHLLLGPHVTYTVSVHNNGPDGSSSSYVILQLPAQLVSIASTPCTLDKANHLVTCPVGALPSGGTRTIVFDAYYGLLTLGTMLPAAAYSMYGVPTDPNNTNNAMGVTCFALTSLIIMCP